MINLIRNNLIWTEGRGILLVLAAVSFIAWFVFPLLLLLVISALLFCLWFFRNPYRICDEAKANDNIMICPADGKIIEILHDDGGLDGSEYSYRVSIFLSPLNVHVNWVPTSGKVELVKHTKGKFLPAFKPKSSELNERNDVLLRGENGRTIKIRQIAGSIARRIVCWVKEGDELDRGQKYGMIKFSSRVDLFLTRDVRLKVKVGDRVFGGKTVLGEWLCL